MKNILYTTILIIFAEYSGNHSVLAQAFTDYTARTERNSISLNYSNFVNENNLAFLRAFIEHQLNDTLRVSVVDQFSNSIYKAVILLGKEGERVYDYQTRVTNRTGVAEFDIKGYKQYYIKVEKKIFEKSISRETSIEFDVKGLTELTVQLNNPPVQKKSSLELYISIFDENQKELEEKRSITLRLSGSKSYEFDATSKQNKIVGNFVEGEYSINGVYNTSGKKFWNDKNKRYESLNRCPASAKN